MMTYIKKASSVCVYTNRKIICVNANPDNKIPEITNIKYTKIGNLRNLIQTYFTSI